MITEFNTNTPGSSTGKTGGMGNLLTIAVIGIALYMGYKYLIKKPTEENVTG